MIECKSTHSVDQHFIQTLAIIYKSKLFLKRSDQANSKMETLNYRQSLIAVKATSTVKIYKFLEILFSIKPI